MSPGKPPIVQVTVISVERATQHSIDLYVDTQTRSITIDSYTAQNLVFGLHPADTPLDATYKADAAAYESAANTMIPQYSPPDAVRMAPPIGMLVRVLLLVSTRGGEIWSLIAYPKLDKK